MVLKELEMDAQEMGDSNGRRLDREEKVND